MKYLIFISILLLSSCNMPKYVANHPNLFPPDSVKTIDKTIHYEKVFITNDSIVFKQLPCDPVTNTIFDTKIIYKTNYKEKTDTIYKYDEVVKMNPINAQLKQENEQLILDIGKEILKAKRKNKIIMGLIATIIGLLLVYKLIK